MRSESDSSGEGDSFQGERSEHIGAAELEETPQWRVIEAGTSNSFDKEFVEPILSLMTKVLKEQIGNMEKEKRHGCAR